MREFVFKDSFSALSFEFFLILLTIHQQMKNMKRRYQRFLTQITEQMEPSSFLYYIRN